jgi:hypothetical protein
MGFYLFIILFIKNIMTLQNISINIEKIIKNNKIEKEYNVIKDMEDKLTEIYQKNNDTDFMEENKLGLMYEIDDNKYLIKIHKNINDVLKYFNLDENIIINNNFVFTGATIRAVLTEKETYRKELFISSINNIDWSTVIKDLDKYEQLDNVYFKKDKNYVINLCKKKYISPSEILLNGPYIKRFGYYNNKFYGSSMFIIEYNLKIKHMISNFIDPVFKKELDLFDLDYPNKKDKKDIFDIIDEKDYEFLVDLTSYDVNKTKNNLTCIEYAIKLYIEEECDIIQQQLKLIIFELLKNIKFIRNPGFYAELIKLDKYSIEMYEILINPDYIKLRKEINSFKSIDELNISILNYYIKNDMVDEFYLYIKLLYKKPSSEIFKNIIELNPKKIITEGINKNYFSEYNIYKIVLLSQNLNYINNFNFNINIAINFIDKIIKNCLTKSFYYLYKQDNSIINSIDSNNRSLLHQIQISENEKLIEDMIRLIITLDENILTKTDISNNTPLLYHAINKNYKIVEILVKIIKEKNLTELFKYKNNNGDTILHILTKSNENLKLIKKIIYDNIYLLNQTNNNNETPILLSCKNCAEDIYYLLKGLGADLNIIDIYGNLPDHYICLNEICIGMAIHNKENYFGFTPSDYCKISKKYYYFI